MTKKTVLKFAPVDPKDAEKPPMKLKKKAPVRKFHEIPLSELQSMDLQSVPVTEDDLNDFIEGFVPDWASRERLTTELEQGLLMVTQKFRKAHEAEYDSLKELNESYRGTLDRFKVAVKALRSQGIMKILGSISPQLRKRAGAIEDREAFEQWARNTGVQLLTVPSSEGQVQALKAFLVEVGRTDLLVVDDKAALKAAMEVYDDGTRVYPECPVDIEEYITDPSEDTFKKTVGTARIKVEFEARMAADES